MKQARAALVGGPLAALLLTSLLVVSTGSAAAQDAPFYTQDFEVSAGPEWSPTTTSTSPSGQKFLGRFGNQVVKLTLTDLPAHTELHLEFDFYVVGTMDGSNTSDGPDTFRFAVDQGPTLQRTTFSNVQDGAYDQAFPDDYPGTTFYAAGTGSSATNALGYPPNNNNPSDFFGDTTYELAYDFVHRADSVTFSFTAAGLVGGGGAFEKDESWGIDNVAVSASLDTAAPQTTITKKPPGTTSSTTATFKFKSSEPGSKFKCKLDKKSFAPCVSPKTYRNLAHKQHTFKVRATDPAGNTDATPAQRTWKVTD